MRIIGKVLLLAGCIVAFTLCNTLFSLFHSPQTPLHTTPLSFLQEPPLPKKPSTKCPGEDSNHCLHDVNTRSGVGVGIPTRDDSGDETSLDDIPGGEKIEGIDTDHFLAKDDFLPQGKNINKDYAQEGPTPIEYVDMVRKGAPNVRIKKKFSLGFFSGTDPHSPQKLQQRMNNLTNNSDVVKFVKEQKERKLREKEYCSKHYNKTDLGGFDNIIVDREFYLTFCPVYKAASTSWIVNLLKLKGMWKNTKHQKKVQKLVSQVFQKVSNIVAPWMSKGTTKFLIGRHPFHRLISCYRDKFENAAKLYYYERYGEKMVRAFRRRPKGVYAMEASSMLNAVRNQLTSQTANSLPGNPFAHPVGPTFEEFIKYVITSKYNDDHWRPIYLQCSLCHMTYDFVLRFENLFWDSKMFVEYLNQSSVIQTGWENPTSDGTTTSAVVCKYFKTISTGLMDKLLLKYRHDFELFNYSQSDFLKCSKDSDISVTN